jgi:hypothetical protein
MNAAKTLTSSRTFQWCTSKGDDLGKRLFFKVEEAGYSWVLTPQKYIANNGETCDFHANVGVLPTGATKCFYMIGGAVEGSEGAVYIACNSSARLCAIKVYRIYKSSVATSEGRDCAEEAASANCWEKAKEECEHWTQIYKERFKHVRRLYLGGRHVSFYRTDWRLTLLEIRQLHSKLSRLNYRGSPKTTDFATAIMISAGDTFFWIRKAKFFSQISDPWNHSVKLKSLRMSSKNKWMFWRKHFSLRVLNRRDIRH